MANERTPLEKAEERIAWVKVVGDGKLYLTNLGLTTLPESLAQLTRLHELYLNNNQLHTLPEGLGQLMRLRLLDLSTNRLRDLPEFMGQLTRLHSLYLDNNQLRALPESLRQLKELKALYLHGNDELGIPAEVLGPTWIEVAHGKAPANPNDILAYYFRVQKPAERRALMEGKLILVGRGGAGKTSVVQRLVDGTFDPRQKKTDGIKITDWDVRVKENETARLHVWDFGGQEIMHATHQFFLTQRSLYLLVLDGRGGLEDIDADYWLRMIESFGTESPVIVVLNKIHEYTFDVNRRALQEKYPGIRAFIETDCEDGTGIQQLDTLIRRETDRLKDLRAAFPASWFEIKEKLLREQRNFLRFDEYRDFCAKHGEPDEQGQIQLAVFLHQLGIALNYRDNPRLQDTHVLNPHWVTNGIYKILNSPRLAEQKGMLQRGDVPKVLTAKQYPPAMHQFLIDLMEKFELCFSFPKGDRHLIPELLDKQEPEEAGRFKAAECLNFQYHYPVVPEGLIPRFIVRTHSLSEGRPRWRTGVILEFEGNEALVKADREDKKVFISIKGPVAGRRRLLAVIRSDFERIHGDIARLDVQEMVPVPNHPEQLIPYQDLLTWEGKGLATYQKRVGDDVLDLPTAELLSGIDVEGTRRRKLKREPRGADDEALQLFYSYSHKDERYRLRLETQLKILERRGLIAPWHDRKITAGDEWKGQIDENLEQADIILLLVSADFIASDYCYEKEMTKALEMQDASEATVVPVIVRDVSWEKTPFAKLQALPKDGKAVKKWLDMDTAWRNVADGIERIVEKMRKQRGRS